MDLETVVTGFIRCDPMTAFRGASSTEDLPRIFPGKGLIPGVERAEVVGGGEIGVGKVRRVRTLDGNELDESYIQFDPPHAYAYEMTGLKPPLRLMMKKATGSWKFEAADGGTKIVWTYACEVSTVLMAPITALVVKVFMNGAMARCLERLKEGIENKPA